MYEVIEGKYPNITKKDPRRQHGKILNLKLDYGGTAYSVKDDLGKSQEEAEQLIEALSRAFPGKTSYFEAKITETFAQNYILIDDVTKRKSYLEKHFNIYNQYAGKDSRTIDKKEWSKFFTAKSSIERAAKNYPIQGTGGSMTKLASILFYKWIQKNSMWDKVHITNLVHDEIVVECIEKLADKVAEKLTECMVFAGSVFCKKVPMKAEPVITQYWKH